MSYIPTKGKSFLIPSGPQEDGKHLFVIVTNRCPADCYLLLSISSVEAGEYHDSACRLRPGDHSFIQHLSYVMYSKAVILPHDEIVKRVGDFTFLIKDDGNDEFVEKIRNGIEVSKRTSKKIRTYFAAAQSL